jgi:hypothetical protein
MDSYFTAANPDKPRREVMRIVADNDADALAEASRLDSWKRSHFYEVRSIESSARSRDKVIFSSRVEELARSDAT